MRKSVWLFLTALTLSTASMAVACGDDDDNPVNPPPGTADAGGDTGSNADAGPGGCTFAGFVTNLINTQTNGTAMPSTDLGDQCTPSTSQDDFRPLFP